MSIAFWEIGEGKPVVIIHNFGLSHAELEWTVPSIASFYVEMAQRYRLVRFDPRGIGLSGDPPDDSGTAMSGMSTHEMCLDIEAVAAACGLEKFALMAVSVQGPIGIEFAAKHPDMVTELILYDAVVDVGSSHLAPILKVEYSMVETEVQTGRRLPFNPWERVVPREEFDAVLDLVHSRTGTPPGMQMMEWNAEEFLEELDISTLVMWSRNNTDPQSLLLDARRLAAGISGSQLRVIDGTYTPYFADRDAVLRAIDGFLRPEFDLPGGFRTVVFTDVVGSTEFMGRVGDEEGRAALRRLEQRVNQLAEQHHGRVIKNLGDGSLVSFGSNTEALWFALELQDQDNPDSLRLRIGMAAGEPIHEDGDIHGAVVAQANRIANLGDASEIVVSDTVRQLAIGKSFNFQPMGQVELKGFDEPAIVWKLVSGTAS